MGDDDEVDVTGLHFDQAPIRQVFLTLHFASDDHIQASHVAPLRSVWKDDFPLAVELAPMPPIEDSEDGATFLSSSGVWPLPFTRWINIEGDRSIAFQNDRFQVAWVFDPETDSSYPGFDALAGSLADRFKEFQSALDEVGTTLTLTGSECRYINVLQGLSAPEAAVGVLTGWTATPSAVASTSPYVNVHLHACPDEDSHQCSAILTIDSMDDNLTTMAIRVSRVVQEGTSLPLGGLFEAHEEVDRIFVRFTSPHQHKEWKRTA